MRQVLRMALWTYRDHPGVAGALRAQLSRLDEPLRVAIAGKVKAGKSTLLNALVGEAIAATDAGECTKVVTWYRDGPAPRILMHPKEGQPRPVPVVRRDGVLEIDLGGTPAERLDRLVVDWPAQSLRAMTLIDTPGIASLSTDVAARSLRFLGADEDTPTEADAVLYLMRHLHVSDVDFLESFRDQGVARAAAVNTVAVLSRADEIGAGRIDAMVSARGIATRYRAEPALRDLCQNVVAVAGLLAHTGRTLRHSEFVELRDLAALDREKLDSVLLSADRFIGAELVESTVDLRRQLLQRFGVFGIRLATTLIRQGAGDPTDLARELVDASGLPDLQQVLHIQFAERYDVLKARSALLALARTLRVDDGRGLAGAVDRLLTSTHEFVELRLLSALRAGTVTLPQPLSAEAERLLGDHGVAAPIRLGLPAGTDPRQLHATALATLQRWRQHAEDPVLGHRATTACRVIIRTCEGMLAHGAGALAPGGNLGATR
ncbi:MAG TPA: dynamin family protein [Actinophytocola sp.]|uniref:dynamin family protein n=1 Tax=Actinophytocola sp. TaxID=1872138 RepID=UPI002E05585E|nr:dynamin family protein [Actinophytocola sp.]